ncbi:DUF2161 domain-containing phosphodiesterase [Paenibacillus pini]|uniref:Uncharacterized protein n=1 Tax=Paenibacillus pini JCM 16418 TaxID=1236976 RepID=W7YCQ7_9BACL|nr:DUF2161 family putative PD-(D/E)XK-type phosphodiesterase [Paenibacillus pini]GAF06237.1 hypothetical protein JCM16418_187 [Paenibacillus pini JCM 16418]
MSVRHETELYDPLKFFFEQRGYEIKGEVRHCDLVGIIADEEEPLIVEMKKTFNLSLLLQGMERLKISNHVYLAVERSRAKRGAVNQRWGEIATLCSKLGLGLMTVTFYKSKKPFVEVICEPGSPLQAQRKLKSRKTRLLNEFRERSGDYNVGGSTRAKLMTAYREKALRVALALSGSSTAGASPAALRDVSGIGSTASILQKNYYGWFERIARGRYNLTREGIAALEQYSSILEVGTTSFESADKPDTLPDPSVKN